MAGLGGAEASLRKQRIPNILSKHLRNPLLGRGDPGTNTVLPCPQRAVNRRLEKNVIGAACRDIGEVGIHSSQSSLQRFQGEDDLALAWKDAKV